MVNELSRCIVCGKEYKTCFNCAEKLKMQPWTTVCDTQNCYKVHIVVHDFNYGYITKEEAKKKLEKVEYVFADLKEDVQKVVGEITGEKVEKVEKAEKVEETEEKKPDDKKEEVQPKKFDFKRK